jgi:uncharacterized protein (DUF433 family)
MRWQDRITFDKEILDGKPVVKGTRISVEFIIRLLAQGWSVEQVLHEYDHLVSDDIIACLMWAAETTMPDDHGGGAAMSA